MVTFDRLFEKGFLSFAALSVVTVIICEGMCRILIARSRKSARIQGFMKDGKIVYNDLIEKTIRIIIWFIGCMVILRQITALRPLGDMVMGASSIIAAAVGISAQTTFENYVAGFFLTIQHPFKAGDLISLRDLGISGVVKDITLRHTVIITRNGTEILIPNTKMNQEKIEKLEPENFTKPIEFKVALDTDLNQLQKLINVLIRENPYARQEESLLIVKGFDREGYSVSFALSASDMYRYTDARNSLLPALHKALEEHHISVV